MFFFTLTVLTISVMELSSAKQVDINPVRFSGRSNDSIEMTTDMARNSPKDHLAKSLLVSYENLHQILDTKFSSERRINSRILNLVLNKKHLLTQSKPRIKLQSPINIELTHLRTQHFQSQPICVQWDPQNLAFSDEGCKVLSSNIGSTVCQCDLLFMSGFALLAKEENSSPIYANEGQADQGFSMQLLIICVVSTVCLTIVLLLLILVSCPSLSLYALTKFDLFSNILLSDPWKSLIKTKNVSLKRLHVSTKTIFFFSLRGFLKLPCLNLNLLRMMIIIV